MILAIAARNRWHAHQIDVKSAYLNGMEAFEEPLWAETGRSSVASEVDEDFYQIGN